MMVDIPRIVNITYNYLHYCFDLEGRGLSTPFTGKIRRVIWVQYKMILLSEYSELIQCTAIAFTFANQSSLQV